MGDTTIKKIDSDYSPTAEHGEKFLATGVSLAMRKWEDEEPGEQKPEVSRPYETVGYVLKGKAELQSEGQTVVLQPGDSYVVPKGAKHTYKILETFSAVEVTSPPAHLHDRD
ncbi:Cupin domain-containing protein [Catalinimonas alkaloidigena]|uniref:Cupin domain-containing protein n=1 Tax=Catalinimonas alkaloidigena TaxID=1075417 RepID=A0A1G9EMC1_9BACT|nr:cupin domain-containing protein [Catalinimonas alkaloidigena]SDK77264.1 Cupin domain-containing protein [Catalinimonas alkaloidigena]